MHGRLGNRYLLALGLIGGLAASRNASAQVTDAADCPTTLPACSTSRTNCCSGPNPSGSTGGIIIPLDRCHQSVVANSYDPVASNSSPNWCALTLPSTMTHNNGMNDAFGLAYRMMQWTALHQSQPIPFYWIVNPSKAPSINGADGNGGANATNWTEKDVDMWVLTTAASPPASGGSITGLSGTAPVTRLKTNASNVLVTDTAYTMNEFPIRGSAFYIPPQYRANFDAFWAYRSGRTGCGVTNTADCYDFTDVVVYSVDKDARFAWQDFTQSLSGGKYVLNDNQMPVAMRVDYAPPKVAVLMSGNDMSNWLKQANLQDFATNNASCVTGSAVSPSDAIECTLTDADVQAGKLISGGFTWAWFESTGNSCSDSTAIASFLTGVSGSYSAGNAFFFNESIGNVAEVCSSGNLLGITTATNGLATSGTSPGEPLIIPYPANLFAQYGDMPLSFASGSTSKWQTNSSTTGASLYNPVFFSGSSTLRRLVVVDQSPAVAGNPVCTNHDDYNHTSATSSSSCFSQATTVTSGAPTGDYQDVYAYGRYNNNTNNGIVFYAPGQNITQNGKAAQLRLVLSALIATPPLRSELTQSQVEITRSSPVAGAVAGASSLVQGSYEFKYVTYNIGGTNVNYQMPRSYPTIFTHDDVALFTFPWPKGHMRAIPVGGNNVSTTATQFSSETATFDAAIKLPSANYSGCSGPPFSIGCRNVFTANNDWTATSQATRVMVDETHVGSTIKKSDGTASTLGAMMLPSISGDTAAQLLADQNTMIDRILAGDNTTGSYLPGLGGVDRSTVAVIAASSSVGSARPTIAYFGATDGMLHAVCADNTISVCAGKLGTELWAFLPRENLGNLRFNAARIDGSPRVVDMTGYFSTCSPAGQQCSKTVLTFATGSGDPTSTMSTQPALYALDVTDPTDPKVLWDYFTPITRGTYEMGVGLTIAQGDVTISSTDTNLTMIETNNGGTGSAGVVLTAIKTDTGAKQWQFAYPYPALRTSTNVALPSTGMPGGAVTIDKTDKGGNAAMSDVVFGDLYGNLWLIDPTTGQSRYTSSGTYYVDGVAKTGRPLFSFSSDYHPIGAKPAIYNNGNIMYAVIVDGGYADTSLNTGWGLNSNQHYALAISLNTPSADATIDENKGGTDIPFKVPLGSGERGYAQATVVGNEVFITTDNTSVNSATYGTSTTATGHAYSYNLSTSTQGTTVAIQNGASSIAAIGTALYESSGGRNQQLSASAAGTSGATVTASVLTAISRKLWIRTQ